MTKQIIFAEAVHPAEITQQTANAFCHFMLFHHSSVTVCEYCVTYYFSQLTFIHVSAAFLSKCFLGEVKEGPLTHKKTNE